MADEPEVVDFLRSIFARVRDRLDRIETRLGEIVLRPSAVERDLAAITPLPNCGSTTWIAGWNASSAGWS